MLDTDTILSLFSDEEAAREVFAKMLIEQGFENKNEEKMQPMDRLIKELRAKTSLSIRKIAAITGLNKDKVNKILRS